MRVFITGASSGLGAALAAHYARQGAILGLVARRADALEAVRRELGTTSLAYLADVADLAAMRAAANDFIGQRGVPDIVIANAGISIGTLGAEVEDLPVLERLLRTNFVGLAATLTPFIAPMRERANGILAGIASIAGFRGLAGAGAYSASKAAAIKWLESIRIELRDSGVAVVTICPGYIDTPMTRVNKHRMPFMLSADQGARRVARAIAARRRLAVIPWQMALVGYGLRYAPNWLFDPLGARAPRKHRRNQVEGAP